MSGAGLLQLGRLLVLAGFVLVGVGLIFVAGSKLPFLGLGRLPGDLTYKGKNVQVYFPIVTCLILSVALTAVCWIISFFTRR